MKNAHKWKRWVSVAGVVGLVLVTMRWHSSVVSQPIAKSDAATVVDLGRATCSEKFTAIEDNGRMLFCQWSDRSRQWSVGQVGCRETVPLSVARGMNAAGQVCGAVHADERSLPAVWDSQTGVTTIDVPTSRGIANAVNDHGEVVGTCFDGKGIPQGFFWSEKTGLLMFDSLMGTAGSSNGKGINDRGLIVGQTVVDNASRGFVWNRQDGSLVLLATEADASCANAVNDQGWVVGHYRSDGAMRAFAWHRDHGLIELKKLLPQNSEWELYTISTINDRGDVLGVGARNGIPREFFARLDEDALGRIRLDPAEADQVLQLTSTFLTLR